MHVDPSLLHLGRAPAQVSGGRETRSGHTRELPSQDLLKILNYISKSSLVPSEDVLVMLVRRWSLGRSDNGELWIMAMKVKGENEDGLHTCSL